MYTQRYIHIDIYKHIYECFLHHTVHLTRRPLRKQSVITLAKLSQCEFSKEHHIHIYRALNQFRVIVTAISFTSTSYWKKNVKAWSFVCRVNPLSESESVLSSKSECYVTARELYLWFPFIPGWHNQCCINRFCTDSLWNQLIMMGLAT